MLLIIYKAIGVKSRFWDETALVGWPSFELPLDRVIGEVETHGLVELHQHVQAFLGELADLVVFDG